VAPSSARGSGQNSTARATKNGSRTRNDVRAFGPHRVRSPARPRGVHRLRRRAASTRLGCGGRRDLSACPDCDSPGGHAIPGLGEASHRSCPSPAFGCR
jgi:hypothetical protein